MDSLTVKQLLEKARSGDAVALGDLLQNYRPYLQILARRHLDSNLRVRVDPSDVVQQTCLEAHRDLPQFRGGQELELLAWLRQILRNNVSQAIQKHIQAQRRSIRRERPLDPGSGHGLPRLGHVLADDQSTPSRRAMRDEHAVRLAMALDQLSDDQREAVRLRHLEGYSLKQLAAHFERSEVAVAGLLKRGLRMLRKTLSLD